MTSNAPCNVFVPEPPKTTSKNAWPLGFRFWLAPLKVTEPEFAVKVPLLVHVPDTLILALGALRVAPELMTKIPNCVPATVDPPNVVVPDLENVTVLAALIVNAPPLIVKLAPAIVTLRVFASSVPLLMLKVPFTVMALLKVTFPPTVRLFSADDVVGNSLAVVKVPV